MTGQKKKKGKTFHWHVLLVTLVLKSSDWMLPTRQWEQKELLKAMLHWGKISPNIWKFHICGQFLSIKFMLSQYLKNPVMYIISYLYSNLYFMLFFPKYCLLNTHSTTLFAFSIISIFQVEALLNLYQCKSVSFQKHNAELVKLTVSCAQTCQPSKKIQLHNFTNQLIGLKAFQ